MMLTNLMLRNYRGFRQHSVSFGNHSILVGRNNTGKSTIIEALRLVSVVTSRAANLTYHEPPDWLDMPVGSRGVSPSLRGTDFDYRNLHHQYGKPPSLIRAHFATGERISIYLNTQQEEVFAVIYRPGDKLVMSRAHANALALRPIQIMPIVGPLSIREKVLSESYVNANVGSNLSSLHFRNQLHYFPKKFFTTFSSLAENTWPQLQIKALEAGDSSEDDISLLIRDGRFVAEVGWVGQGLQSWLQTLWFLSRTSPDDTVVFDEPDVYLHADLQRKLSRFLRRNYSQTIVATHSLEIISDVSPESLVVLDRSRRKSGSASTLPAVQNVMDNLGGAYNLQLMRLWNAKKCLFVEGKDVDFLDIFHMKMFPENDAPLSSVPNISLGGSGNWQYAVGATIGFKNAGDEEIHTYCLLDRDYKQEEDVREVQDIALEKGLDLKYWRRKEIENYVLVPEAIRRLILARSRKGTREVPRLDTVLNRVDRICEELKQEVIDHTADSIFQRERALGLPKANRIARSLIEECWKSGEGRLTVVPGKKVISELSAWSKKNYGASFGPLSIAREMFISEIDDEVKAVIGAIDKALNLPK